MIQPAPSPLIIGLDHPDRFADRHLGPDASQVASMVQALGYDTLEALIAQVVPEAIRRARPMDLPEALSEPGALAALQAHAVRNLPFRSYLGQGYHDCVTPAVIRRNVLENPGWYTQYTPYQAEIAQGRLEGLLTFQTMVGDLTGLPIANASMLDEATAAAEAMGMCWNLKGSPERPRLLVCSDCHPQTMSVVTTRAHPLGIEVEVVPPGTALDARCFGILLQYPGSDGQVRDLRPAISQAHDAGGMAIVACDLLALTLLMPPGECGADVAVGSAQRFGVPLGFGGPHAGFLATRDEYKRQMPGRIVGVSKDARGKPALRLALQTREQHIRREKATSNICTAQALLANMAAMYAVYHGPAGLAAIASRAHRAACILAAGVRELGYSAPSARFFDTIRVGVSNEGAAAVVRRAEAAGINLRLLDPSHLIVALDETVGEAEITALLRVFAGSRPLPAMEKLLATPSVGAGALTRTSSFLTHEVFARHHSETEMLRFLRRLESRDLSLTHSMIPLGSCTMKLNASSEMLPVTWPEFAAIHPFAPHHQVTGYLQLFTELERWLCEITGFAACSLQPNAGSQGEYAGLLAIMDYQRSQGHAARRACLIPTSAHGTNPASAALCGMQVIAVACDNRGNIDIADLTRKASEHAADLACLMITYPSTHGVFEASIREACRIVHAHGGQVYMDGANLNAQVGLCSPGDLGADVCHLNLHKTFCIPHGGGGPGMGPICCASHLAPYLPGHPTWISGRTNGTVSAAPWGSALILTISWMYIAMMGAPGLTRATQLAILNANYIARRLAPYFPVLYTAQDGLVAHECILDMRQFKATSGVEVEDIAKRLMDYGFHAPTVSFPVAGTLMIEPTESESQPELDRFCSAMISIHGEISDIAAGRMDRKDNPLKNAPHTADEVVSSQWTHPYPRELAAFPTPRTRERKFWPAVARVDSAYGDRHLVCTCPPMESYA